MIPFEHLLFKEFMNVDIVICWMQIKIYFYKIKTELVLTCIKKLTEIVYLILFVNKKLLNPSSRQNIEQSISV